MKEIIIIENDIKVYKNRYCKCGCGRRLQWRKWYKSIDDIPDFINHHYSKCKEFKEKYCFKKGNKREFKEGNKIGKQFTKGHKLNVVYPDNWIDEYGNDRHKSKVRGFNFIPLNKRTKEANSPHHLDRELVVFIPRKLHESFYHSVKRNINTEEMNNLACNYMMQQYFEEFNELKSDKFKYGVKHG